MNLKITVVLISMLFAIKNEPLLKEITVSTVSSKKSIRTLFEENGLHIVDSITVNQPIFLFEQIKDKSKIDLIYNISAKYIYKVSPNIKSKEMCNVSIYQYTSDVEAKNVKLKLDSLSKLTSKQIDPMLFDFLHNTSETYHCNNNSILFFDNDNGQTPCSIVRKAIDSVK